MLMIMWHIRLLISAGGPRGGGGGAFSFLIPQPDNFHLLRDEIMSSLCQLMIFAITCMYTHEVCSVVFRHVNVYAAS